jgi:predicted PurR-regulated permease PerM
VLLAALVGATVLGIVGALVAIPVAAAVKVVLAQQIAEHEATAVPDRPHHQRFRRRPRPDGQDPPP